MVGSRKRKIDGSGLGVDLSGGPVIDPTANVLDTINAVERRQDDLRQAESMRIDQLRAAEVRRTDDLRSAETLRLDEKAVLRDTFNERLAIAESKRIDAIRAVDVNAVAVERQRSSDQASVLAAQVSQSAETLRSLVGTTAAAVATLQAAFDVRLKSVEQIQSEGKGKSLASDPASERLATLVEKLVIGQSNSGGERRGSDRILTATAIIITILVSFGGLIFTILHNSAVMVKP